MSHHHKRGERGRGRIRATEKEGLRMMCWNVCGWYRKCMGQSSREQDGRDIRKEVISFYEPDILAVVETWLKGEESILVGGTNGLVTTERICKGEQ